MRSKASVWWPGIAAQITRLVDHWPTCSREAQHRREPLLTTQLPDYPWQMLGSDLFDLNRGQYLLVCDYFSCYFEVVKLTYTTSSSVIEAKKTSPASVYQSFSAVTTALSTPQKSLRGLLEGMALNIIPVVPLPSGKCSGKEDSPKGKAIVETIGRPQSCSP